MKKIQFLHRSSLYLLALLCIFIPGSALGSSYTVTPLVIDHELEKRDIIEETITLTNRDSKVVRIFPTVNEISVSEGGAIQSFVTPAMADRTTSITSWLEIGRGRIDLQPGESRELTLTIRVNPEVAPGEYHAFVGFPEGSNRPNAEKKLYEGSAPGAVVRIGVDKVQNQFLRLERFSVERFIKDATEGDISYTLHNPGKDPVVPGGEIIFYDNNGNEVGAVPVNTEQTTVNGGSEVAFTGEVPEEMKMGKYKAFLSIEYGEHQTASIHDTAFFYVMPLKTIIVIFVIILLLAIALALFVHKRFDVDDVAVDADEVALYIREGRSESKDHDIDLSNRNGKQ